jgi:hypothetical protein
MVIKPIIKPRGKARAGRDPPEGHMAGRLMKELGGKE